MKGVANCYKFDRLRGDSARVLARRVWLNPCSAQLMSLVAEAVPHSQSEGIRLVARIGYGTKGVLYFALGLLAIQSAVGAGQAEGGQGTMKVISQQPFGMVLLGVTVCGLFGYSFWRAVQAIKDTESAGNGFKGWIKRIGFGVSCLSHLGLAIAGIQMLVGESDGSTKKTFLAQLMSHPAGQVLLVIAGGCIIGTGVAQLVKAKTTKFADDIEQDRMNEQGVMAAIWVGRIGLAARGIVFTIIGYSLIHASITESSWREQGLEPALNEIRSSSFGSTMLFVVAVGLSAYGLYQLVLAGYRKIQAPG